MEWSQLYDQENQPSYDDIEAYICSEGNGDGLRLWRELFAYMEIAFNSKPKMAYSVCSGKPGWNVKFTKSGVAFGTLYPEPGMFSVFVVIAYKLAGVMDGIKPLLSETMRERFESAGDFMRNGRWMMFPVICQQDLEDYKLLMSAKMSPRR